jgi:formamidopyrimidine-DNA glycosylase
MHQSRDANSAWSVAVPELPDVEGQRRSLTISLLGRTVLDVTVLDPRVLRNATQSEFEQRLIGCRFGPPARHGKWLILPTDRVTLLLHNGMTGRVYFLAAGALGSETTASPPGNRLIVRVEGGQLRFTDRRALGGVWIADHPGVDIVAITGLQGPDALGIPLGVFQTLLRGRRATVKSTLMDQSVIAGLGNMLSDEICWRARLHPSRAAASLSAEETQKLHRALRWTTRRASECGLIPRTPTWLSSARDKDPAACPRCKAGLRRSRIRGRTALWCPRCQPDNP